MYDDVHFLVNYKRKKKGKLLPKRGATQHEENSQYPYANMHFIYFFLHWNRYSQPISPSHSW
jgi:hypothetical protein